MAQMRDAFESAVLAACHGSYVHGRGGPRLPTTSSICFPGLSAAEMLILLDKEGIQCSAGSACHTANVHPSHVLQAMHVSAQDAAATLRFSFSRFTAPQEASGAVDKVIKVEKKLRLLAQQTAGPVLLST
jgi:cysteine desulfurase